MSQRASDLPGSDASPTTKRIVLVGGGHAHVQVIKALNARSRPSYLEVTLIDLQSSASYSGMVPVTDEGGVVTERAIPFDVVSIDIGSTTRDFSSIPGAREHTISTRPISDLVRRIQKEDEVLREKLKQWALRWQLYETTLSICQTFSKGELPDGAKVVVVGGGAAGIELSLALRSRWNSLLDSKLSVTLFAAGDCCEIVNENRKSPPKAGVYAVRSGPIIIENLTRFCERSTKNDEAKTAGLITYHPQDDFMKLLMCGDGTALGFRFGIPIYGKWVWQLKDTIDRMFMDLFDVKNLPNPDKPDKECCSDEDRSYDTSQYDAYEATEERMSADDAGKLLLRTDEDVDFQLAWNVIRDMMSDKKYKGDVLGAVLAQQMSGRI
ncbi:hypothetical protein ACHAWF_012595 [Thalassiosira exigua]